MTRSGLALVVSVAVVLIVRPTWGEDSDQTHYYLALRLGEKVPGLSDTSDLGGVGAGVNWGRMLSFEMAVDSFELRPEKLSEVSVLGLFPQVRLRQPVFTDRLSPYLLAGAGLVVSQANDARVPVDWSGGKTRVHPAGTLGGGVDYFMADNLALMIEAKYLFSGDVSYRTSERRDSIALSNALFTGGFRVFYPELSPAEGAKTAETANVRFYVAPRAGAAVLLHGTPFPGVKASPEQPILGSDLDPLLGVSVGAEFGRFASVEVSLENYELALTLPGKGRIGEYAVFPFTVQTRFRHPLFGGRLEPYALGGVGAELGQLNDKSPTGREMNVSAKDITFIGDLGVGVDYRLMSNVRIGCQTKYIISRGHRFEINGVENRGNLDSLVFSFGLSVVPFSRVEAGVT